MPTPPPEEMLKLECHSNGFEAGFSLKRLTAKKVPYSIRFSGSNNCSSVDGFSVNHIRNGRLWIGSNYTQCGIKSSEEGDSIAFEQKLIVEYRTKNQPPVYRSPITFSYRVKCYLKRKVTEKMNIEVEDEIHNYPSISELNIHFLNEKFWTVSLYSFNVILNPRRVYNDQIIYSEKSWHIDEILLYLYIKLWHKN